MKRLGIMTSGGDCPGLNACIRSIVRLGISSGYDILGIKRGYQGLIEGDIIRLKSSSVSGIINQGGTILLSSRSKEFEKTAAGKRKAAKTLSDNNIKVLIVIGGNGTLKGAWTLAKYTNTAIIGIPKSIDNDIGGTDHAIGFDTAVNTAVDAIDKIRDTATSHERLFFVEVMGRKSGQLALAAGLAGGAEEILIPETITNIKKICRKLDNGIKHGKKSSIIVVAEGDEAGGALEIAQKISKYSDYNARVSIIGHVQRGGRPSAFDRILAARLGRAALDAAIRNLRSKMVGIINGKIRISDIKTAWSKKNPPSREMISLSKALAK